MFHQKKFLPASKLGLNGKKLKFNMKWPKGFIKKDSS